MSSHNKFEGNHNRMLKFEDNLHKGVILEQQLISTCSMLCDDWLWNEKQHQLKTM
jgi:hypothetical protein